MKNDLANLMAQSLGKKRLTYIILEGVGPESLPEGGSVEDWDNLAETLLELSLEEDKSKLGRFMSTQMFNYLREIIEDEDFYEDVEYAMVGEMDNV